MTPPGAHCTRRWTVTISFSPHCFAVAHCAACSTRTVLDPTSIRQPVAGKNCNCTSRYFATLAISSSYLWSTTTRSLLLDNGGIVWIRSTYWQGPSRFTYLSPPPILSIYCATSESMELLLKRAILMQFIFADSSSDPLSFENHL